LVLEADASCTHYAVTPRPAPSTGSEGVLYSA
jgi:hypothetical protein